MIVIRGVHLELRNRIGVNDIWFRRSRARGGVGRRIGRILMQGMSLGQGKAGAQIRVIKGLRHRLRLGRKLDARDRMVEDSVLRRVLRLKRRFV